MFFDLIDGYFSAERDEVIAQLHTLARCETTSSEDEGVALSAILAQPRHSEAWVSAEMQQLETKIPVVGASQMHKKLMKAVLTPWLAAYLLDQRPPTADLSLATAAPHRLICANNANATPSPYDFLSTLAERFAVHMHEHHRLPQSVAYGNAALALAVPWSKLATFRHDGEAVAASAGRFFAQLTPKLNNAITWQVLSQDGQSAAYLRRRSCCFKYRIQGKTNCTTCAKVDIDEQRKVLLAKWR